MSPQPDSPWVTPPGPLNLRLRVGDRGRSAALVQLRRSYSAGLIDAGLYDRLMHNIVVCQSRPMLDGYLAQARVPELTQLPGPLRVAQAKAQEMQAQELAEYIRRHLYDAHADDAISLAELDVVNQQLLNTRGSLPRLWKLYEQLGVPYQPPTSPQRVRLARWARWWSPIAWAAFLCSWLATAISWPWHQLAALHLILVCARDGTGLAAVALGIYCLMEADVAEISNTEGQLARDLVLARHPRRLRRLRHWAPVIAAMAVGVGMMLIWGGSWWFV